MFCPFCLSVRHLHGTCYFLSQVFKFVSGTTNDGTISLLSDCYMYNLMPYRKRRMQIAGVQGQRDKESNYMDLVKKIKKEGESRTCIAMQVSLWYLP